MLDYKAIGRRISFYRKKANITQGTLAEKLDISDGYISQIERGTARISLARLNGISEILNVDICCLLSDRAVNSDTVVNSEIQEIIKDWDKDKINLLIGLLNCADQEFKNNR